VSDLAKLVALVAFAFASLSGALVTAIVPVVIAHTARWEPSRRHRALALVCAAPTGLAGAAFIAVFLPSALALAWPKLDHCLAHDDHHLHLCFVHPPTDSISWLVSALLLAASAWLLWRVGTSVTRFAQALRLVSKLRRSAFVESRLGVSVLPSPEPVCALLGLWEPTIVVSKGFLTAVTPEDLDVVIHHEHAHLARRDILWRTFAQATTIFVWERQRRLLLQALELAAEQSCDEAAARHTGDRLSVAETILRVERLLSRLPSRLSPAAASFGGEAVSQRVTALLASPATGGSAQRGAVAFALLVVSLLAAHQPIHHYTESLVAWLTHHA
jgi:BlaR1 peptidase M56